ncbi:MAG: helix-turn-helix domain-containing protein [Lachnospiraceae bacterium]|nr:helix-turn-helix domain-containing protein [Lachnospiraceae bacterium]
MVSWTYMVQTRPYADHMNRGNFALIVVDDVRFSMKEAEECMLELYELGISGLGISVVDDREDIPEGMKAKADELALPLFFVRWEGASFVDIAQSIGRLILEQNVQNKRAGDFLYNLLFGYDINDKYVEKVASQFDFDFSKYYRVGIIVVDRTYGINLEQDEHTYEFYSDCINHEVTMLEGHPMFMSFLNKFVLLFEAREDKSIERALERMLKKVDERPEFKGMIKGTCILGGAYKDPRNFGASYTEAKRLISKKDILPNPRGKKVLSAKTMGIYKYLFKSGNHDEILDYCNERLRILEEYDDANGTFLVDTLLSFYMNGFNSSKTSESLYIHRNSLQYRLNKIEELLGIELDDYVEYLDILNCILVKRWMFS